MHKACVRESQSGCEWGRELFLSQTFFAKKRLRKNQDDLCALSSNGNFQFFLSIINLSRCEQNRALTRRISTTGRDDPKFCLDKMLRFLSGLPLGSQSFRALFSSQFCQSGLLGVQKPIPNSSDSSTGCPKPICQIPSQVSVRNPSQPERFFVTLIYFE